MHVRQIKTNQRLSRILAGCSVMVVLTVLVSLLIPLDAVRAGKGGKNPPPPPLPVNYELTFLGTFGGAQSIAVEINNSGVVVGWADVPGDGDHAFRVVPAVGPTGNLVYDLDGDGNSELMEDLNDLGIWVNEAGDPLVDQNWTAEKAQGVNSHGEIVGTAVHDTSGDRCAFQFDPLTEELMLLPAVGSGDHYGNAINNDGDIVGYRADGNASAVVFYRWDPAVQAYFGWDLGIPAGINYGTSAHLNNRGVGGEVQVVTRAGYRLTVWPNLVIDEEDFGDRFVIWRTNDLGTFCGHRVGFGKGKNGEPDGAFRWSGNPSETLNVILEGFEFAADVNSAGDVSMLYSMFYTDEESLLELNDLVPNYDLFAHAYGLNDRGATGFPQICGRGRKFIGAPMQKYQDTAMVLTPMSAAQ